MDKHFYYKTPKFPEKWVKKWEGAGPSQALRALLAMLISHFSHLKTFGAGGQLYFVKFALPVILLIWQSRSERYRR